MGEQQRKAAKSAPISSNPLFPAVVALWFGALFGLGSLAVRPSLIESWVLNSHFDLILPAAAPPLGITARILIALGLSAIGGVIGIFLARRLTQPAPVHRERKRGAKDLTAAPVRVRSRDAHPDAPARRPISAHEELGPDQADSSSGSGGGQGAMGNRRRALAIVHEEEDFVPHNMAPLPGAEAAQPLQPAPMAAAEPYAPDLPVFDPIPAAPPAAGPQLDWTRSVPPAPLAAAAAAPLAAMPAMIAAQRQDYETPNPVPSEFAQFAAVTVTAEDNRQIFGQSTPAPPSDVARQIFGVSADGDHVPQEFVRAAGFQTSVFDTPEAIPLFGSPVAAAAEIAPSTPEHAPAAEPLTVPEPLPSPATLGMTDLAARLAVSMHRRRQARMSDPGGTLATTLPGELHGDLAALVQAQAAPPVIPGAPVLPVSAPMAMPSIFAHTPAISPEPAIALFAAPNAMPVPAASNVLPAAMRPLALDAFIEGDTGLDGSVLPPRHLAQFVPPATPPETPLELTAEAAPADFDETSSEPAAAEANYGSLLGITPPRQTFARVDEPQEFGEAIEPVVIFPGQAARNHETAPQDSAFRRFDAPASAGHGQPIAANLSATAVNSAEADQALRAALSNLQRMSGAA